MELLELATRLISYNTVTQESSTVEIANFIGNYLESAGFKVDHYPYINENEDPSLRKVNLIARKGGEESFLALSGHMDTVTFNGKWDQLICDPLDLVLSKGRYYARGITDMKLFIAIAMKAGEAIALRDLKRPFALCFTSDEEVGCLGARRLIKSGIHIADSIIVGEPTELVPVYAHKGYVYPIITLLGKGGHSAYAKNGTSVIPALREVLNKLQGFEKKLGTIVDSRFNPPYPTMNIGVVNTDGNKMEKGKIKPVKSSKNMLAEYCRIEMEIRPLPKQNGDELFQVLKEFVGDNINGVEVRVERGRRPTPPMETPPESPVVRIAEKLSGKKIATASFNTEGGVFNKKGFHSIIWGPGSIKQAHTKDEYVEAQYMRREVVDMYTQAIRELCC